MNERERLRTRGGGLCCAVLWGGRGVIMSMAVFRWFWGLFWEFERGKFVCRDGWVVLRGGRVCGLGKREEGIIGRGLGVGCIRCVYVSLKKGIRDIVPDQLRHWRWRF